MIVNRVREFRVLKGLTQAQLAETVEISSRTIISMENQKYNPSLDLAYRIAIALNQDIKEVFIYMEDS